MGTTGDALRTLALPLPPLRRAIRSVGTTGSQRAEQLQLPRQQLASWTGIGPGANGPARPGLLVLSCLALGCLVLECLVLVAWCWNAGAGMPGAGSLVLVLVLNAWCWNAGAGVPGPYYNPNAIGNGFYPVLPPVQPPGFGLGVPVPQSAPWIDGLYPRHRCARSGFTEGLAEAVGYRRSINPSISPTTNPPRCPQLLMRISPNTPAKPSTMNISKKTTRPSGMRKPRSGRCDEISHK